MRKILIRHLIFVEPAKEFTNLYLHILINFIGHMFSFFILLIFSFVYFMYFNTVSLYSFEFVLHDNVMLSFMRLDIQLGTAQQTKV